MGRYRAGKKAARQFSRTAMKTKKININARNSRGGICL